GISKGHGFAGVMKRHNFSGQGASHGNHKKHRAPGAIGACATPARVFKGMKMAGQFGNVRTTTLNLQVVEGDAERNLLLLRGAVRAPQWRGGGVAHGPKPRDYSQRTPKKMVRLALLSALSDRAAEAKIVVVDDWAIDAPKTKDAVKVLEAIGLRTKGEREA